MSRERRPDGGLPTWASTRGERPVAEPPQPDEPAETGGDPTARERAILDRLDAEAPTPGEELTLWEQLRYEISGRTSTFARPMPVECS